MADTRPYYIAGEWRRSDTSLVVTDPSSHQVVGTTSLATPADIEDATVAAERAFHDMRRLSSGERFNILMKIRDGMQERREELILLIVQESGKPVKDAAAEFERALLTTLTAAEEAKRIGGETIPLDWAPSADRRTGITMRFPIGPVLGISPFNFPLNLAMHKLCPAIAAGDPIVLKPAGRTPLVMLAIAEIVDKAGLPKGAVSIFPTTNELAEEMVKDERFKLLTFTGSSAVGWRLKQAAGMKRVLLELGGNAGVIVDASAPMSYAVQRLVTGGFTYAGQSCISVQRILVHDQAYDSFIGPFKEQVRALKMGDTMDPETDLGPMIDEEAAVRAEQWVVEAINGGARVLVGGERKGALFPPTVLENAPPDSKVCKDEAFAPLVVISRFTDIEAAIHDLDDSYYGLQAGIFTRDIEHAWQAFEGLTVGGVIVNDVPSGRVDHMPYGGVKGSGLGREGLRYAIEEMTDLRIMVINRSWAES